MSTLRFSWMALAILSLALTIHGQSSGGNSGGSGGSGGSDTATTTTAAPDAPTKTTGIIGAVTPIFRPITTLLYQTLDSILRNVFNKKLPCTINDFTRLDIECTPV